MKEKGFSLIEVLVVMAILSIVIMLGSETFTAIIKGVRRETGSITSQIETTLALNLIRYDVEHAGYGLCKKFMRGIIYSESQDPAGSLFNDAPSSVPRPIISGNNIELNGSDRLVIKSALSGTNEACTKWSYVKFGETPRVWDETKINIKNGERVIAIKPGGGRQVDELVVSSEGRFFTVFNSAGLEVDFTPKNEREKYVIYAIDPDTDLRMPFNRSDYFIRIPSSGMSTRCAPNTGVLYKANVNHKDGQYNYTPIMDCVADFQVIFGLDTSGDGSVDSYTDDISNLDVFGIRRVLKEVRIYILTHEGKKDKDFRFEQERIYVGEFAKGNEFSFPERIGEGWQNYRWRVYSIVVKPRNL